MDRLTPQTVSDTAAAAISIQKQTGINDPRQALALLQTAASQSAVTESAAMAESLPRALSAIGSARGQTHSRRQRKIASIFAVATKGGEDSSGNSSATFTIDLVNRMGQLFTGLEDQRINARSKIEKIDRRIEGGTATEADRRDRSQLEAFLAETANVIDPGTIAGRLKFLQENQATAKQFTGESGFGEKQFSTVLMRSYRPILRRRKRLLSR